MRKPKQAYIGFTWRKYDLDMMFDGLDQGVDDIPMDKFFEKIKL
jgi:hypothetical protein